jgi:hypothetical protein
MQELAPVQTGQGYERTINKGSNEADFGIFFVQET